MTAIDLALVEEGIEIGKQMMAEMIATYSRTYVHRREARRLGIGARGHRSGRLPERGEPADCPCIRGVSAYPFCRMTSGLLVDALNRCWAPYFSGEPPMTPARSSDRSATWVWCSSYMVAFSGSIRSAS